MERLPIELLSAITEHALSVEYDEKIVISTHRAPKRQDIKMRINARKETYRNLSLVSKQFNEIAKRVFFEHLDLDPYRQIESLVKVLKKYPYLAKRVKSITTHCYGEFGAHYETCFYNHGIPSQAGHDSQELYAEVIRKCSENLKELNLDIPPTADGHALRSLTSAVRGCLKLRTLSYHEPTFLADLLDSVPENTYTFDKLVISAPGGWILEECQKHVMTRIRSLHIHIIDSIRPNIEGLLKGSKNSLKHVLISVPVHIPLPGINVFYPLLTAIYQACPESITKIHLTNGIEDVVFGKSYDPCSSKPAGAIKLPLLEQIQALDPKFPVFFY